MKLFSKLFILTILLVSWILTTQVNAWIKDFFNSGTPEAYICQGDNECGIDVGVDVLKDNLEGIEKNKSASVYIQDVIIFLIGFMSLIAVIYIIYAGFNILIGWGDEEKIKKSKSIIVYVILGLLIIYLAYTIVVFVFDVFGSTWA